MRSATHEVMFTGGLLRRGFWLYIWEITPPDGPPLYYIGRTGDSSSINAQSPFNRMGQHLGFNKNSQQVRSHLEAHAVQPEKCSFRLVAYGPILPEAKTKESHRERRDIVGALEKALAGAMLNCGYEVMNKVNCHTLVDAKRFAGVRAAFAVHFPGLQDRDVGGEL